MRQDQYEKFNKFMNAIDEDFLLEAMADPAERKAEKAEKAERKSIFAGASFKRWALRGGLVACCVLMVLATGKYINPSEDVAHATTLEEIELADMICRCQKEQRMFHIIGSIGNRMRAMSKSAMLT